jgi:uncharacterized protein (TIGR03083 family)
MTSDSERLASYVETWRSTVEDTVALLRSLEPGHWGLPTDLPGWEVRAVAAHLAHLESDLAGNAQQPVEVPELEHVTSAMGHYTEQGPIARRAWAPHRIIDELEASAATRLAQLRAAPPTDGRAEPPRTPAGIGWSWDTLLSNRVVDVWMHQQDIRRAVDRPGGLDTPGAAHTVRVFSSAFGFTVGKRVAPPPGTSAALEVTGPHPVHVVVRVDDNGRAVPAEVTEPTVTLRTDLESYVVLAGGRGAPSEVAVTGDRDLGDRVLAAMAVTP